MASPEITLTHLDEPLFDGADATKRDLVDYLEAVADRIVRVLSGRPLSVIRVRAGQRPFMQKNVPGYAPPWIKTVSVWAESSHREVRYALCDDKATLIWLANQRAVEYHVTLGTAGHLDRPSYLVLDIDPPAAGEFGRAVAAARLVREALSGAGLAGAVKTSGAKGVHVYVPVREPVSADDAAAARALAERATRLGGEKLTVCVALYCTIAALRAARTGRGTRPGGALLLDNPIGRASSAHLVRLQRDVAASHGVQLIYTTGVKDPAAVIQFPNVIRLDNRQGGTQGRRYIVADSDGTDGGLITGVRVAHSDRRWMTLERREGPRRDPAAVSAGSPPYRQVAAAEQAGRGSGAVHRRARA